MQVYVSYVTIVNASEVWSDVEHNTTLCCSLIIGCAI